MNYANISALWITFLSSILQPLKSTHTQEKIQLKVSNLFQHIVLSDLC